MKHLLDTHVTLWMFQGSSMLSPKAEQILMANDSELFFSMASYWEIALKISIGKLRLADNWVSIFDQELRRNDIQWLPIRKQHVLGTTQLPFLHRDPFDRLLVAQARAEGMTLVTADAFVRQYDVQTAW